MRLALAALLTLSLVACGHQRSAPIVDTKPQATQPNDHLVLDLGPMNAHPYLPVNHIIVDRQEVIQGNLECDLVFPPITQTYTFDTPPTPITIDCTSHP